MKEKRESGAQKAGRPTKYTPAIVKLICDAISLGVPNKHAAALAGISEETFCKWQREKIQFSESIQCAAAKGIAARLKVICRVAQTDYKAAAWWLEHVHPERFAKTRVDVHHDGVVENKLAISPALLDEIARARAEHERQRNG